MTSLTNQVAVITGANRGIGKAIAKAFAAEGAKLALCARNADLLEAAAAELRETGADVLAQPVDVSNEQQVQSFFAAVKERFGRVDLLVNNAGAFDGGRLDDVTLAGWNNVIGACLTGAFLCSREAFRIMKQQGAGGSSTSGRSPPRGLAKATPPTPPQSSACGG